MEIENVISELKKLDFSTYSEKGIRELLDNIGKICSIQVFFPER